MSIMYVHPDDIYSLSGLRTFVPVERYASFVMHLPGEIGIVDGVRFIMTDTDPKLREQQAEIRKTIQKLKEDHSVRSCEQIPALQGQCAIIGHVATVIKGPEREVCFYCGAKM